MCATSREGVTFNFINIDKQFNQRKILQPLKSIALTKNWSFESQYKAGFLIITLNEITFPCVVLNFYIK